MIELPGWNDLISVNGFCYSSSMGESPKLNIPLKTSVAPTKGIAPATFVRNSTATYIDNDGILQTAGINVARFQNGRYLCEPAATNILLHSKELSYWNPSCTVTLNAITTPLGLVSDKLSQINAISNSIYVVRTLSVSTSYCFTFLIKNVDATRSRFSPYNTSTGVQLGELLIGWTGSVPSTYSNTGFSSVSYTDMSDGWYLVKCCITTGATGTSHTIRFYPEYAVTTGKSIYLTMIQMEAGLVPTSYIPTAGSSVTRAADVLHYAVGGIITQGQGSLYCEFVVSPSGTTQIVLYLSDGTTANRVFITIFSSSNFSAFITVAGVLQVSISNTAVPPGVIKCLLTYAVNNTSFYVNGVKIGTDTTCQVPTNLSKLSIGSEDSGGAQLNGLISNVKYFKEVLTEAEAIKLTTL